MPVGEEAMILSFTSNLFVYVMFHSASKIDRYSLLTNDYIATKSWIAQKEWFYLNRETDTNKECNIVRGKQKKTISAW